MSRQDYIAIAKILNDELAVRRTLPGSLELSVAKRLADYFATQNTRFNRERFMAAVTKGS